MNLKLIGLHGLHLMEFDIYLTTPIISLRFDRCLCLLDRSGNQIVVFRRLFLA